MAPAKCTDQYIIFDFETSGLNSKYAEVIEISAIKVIDGIIKEQFDTLVKPDNPIDPSSTAVNGITDDMVSNAPSLPEALSDFLDFIEDCTLLGYNIISFDMPILRRIALNVLGQEISNEVIDILYIARKRLSLLPDHKLSTIASHFNISTDGAHRALTDCYITKQCYEQLLICEPQETIPKKRTQKRSSKPKPSFTDQTKALQTLQGFLLGIIADDILAESEVLALKKWLDNNSDLAGQYPFDRIFSVIEKALEDGILEQNELDEMLILFKKFTSPVDDTLNEDLCDICSIDLKNKSICLTGDFDYGSRKSIETFIEQAGGICKNAVSGKTDYVIVGNQGSPDWSYANYGSKIKRALELQAEGAPIRILKEDELIKILEIQGVITGNEFGGISVSSKISAQARVSPELETSQISRRINIAPPAEKSKNETLNRVLKKMLIVTFSLLAIALMTLFMVNTYIDHYTNLAYERYTDELTTVLSELENSPSFRIEDSHVKIIIPTKLLNDPNFSKETYCKDIQNTITATRNQWELLIDDPCVPVIFYDAQSNQVAIADSTGKIQVK